MRLVLASSSPSRRLILTAAGIDPIICPADVDEDALLANLGDSPASERVQALARAKCAAVSPRYPRDVVIGCDSMLLIGGVLQGKPHSYQATVSRWKEQAGRKGVLLTAHTMTFDGAHFEEVSQTDVSFATPMQEDIEWYAGTGEPLECAGAFTLEARGGWFIDRIEGDPSGVVGLSLPTLRRGLYSFGLTVRDVALH